MSNQAGSTSITGCSRRTFLGGVIGCGTHVLMAVTAAGLPRKVLAAAAAGVNVANLPFAKVSKIAEGVWTVESTPWRGDTTTVCNGGIVAGTREVAVIEAFNTAAGAAWIGDLTFQLTGKEPSHLIVSHFHPDHTTGIGGFETRSGGPTLLATAATGQILVTTREPAARLADTGRLLLPRTQLIDSEQPTEIDLGGKTLRITPRQGHTVSDCFIDLLEDQVRWCGDLAFNGVFPYFGDALPSALMRNANELLKDPNLTYVPGHGTSTDAAGLTPYLSLLDDLEAAARTAHTAGTPAVDAAKAYRIPDTISAWTLFRPDMVQVAFESWERELSATPERRRRA